MRTNINFADKGREGEGSCHWTIGTHFCGGSSDCHGDDIVIVISKHLKRYSKLSAPGHQLIHERCDESNGGFQRGSREAQVRFPEYQEGTE